MSSSVHMCRDIHVHVHVLYVPGLGGRLEIRSRTELTSAFPFLRPLFPPPSDSELDPSLDELPLLLLLLELLLELKQAHTFITSHMHDTA